MGAFDDFRSRISWSPSPSRTSKSSPANVSRSSSSRLSKEKIDEILDNPVETDYTYRHSLSYKSDGSEEYEHPRLCRRPFQPSTCSSFSSTPVGSGAATARDIDISYQVAVDDRCHRIEYFTILKKFIVSKRNWFFIVLLLTLVVGHHLFNNKTNDCPPERFHEGDNRVVLQNKSTLQNSSDMLLEMLYARDINISDQVAVDDRCHRIERFMSILKKQFHELHCENRLIDNETLEDIDISLSPHISNETGLTTLNHIPTMSSQQVCYDHSARHFNIFLGKCWYNDAPCDKVVRRHVLVALRIHFNKLYLNPFHWHPKKLTFEWKFAL